MDEMAKFRDAAEAEDLHVLHTLNHDGLWRPGYTSQDL